MHLPRDILKARDFLFAVKLGVQPLPCHALMLERPILRRGQCDDIRAAKAEVRVQRFAFAVTLPPDRYAHDPAPCTRRIDKEVEATTIAVPAGAESANKVLRQFA